MVVVVVVVVVPSSLTFSSVLVLSRVVVNMAVVFCALQ